MLGFYSLGQQQMSGESLDYHIVKKEQYFLEGKIDSIYQKNSAGFVAENITDKFEFEIKLKAKSIVYCIEIKPKQNTKLVIFQLFGDKDKEHTSVTQRFDGVADPRIVMTDNKEKNLVTSKIKVALTGGFDEKVGIVYMLVRGERFEEKGKKIDAFELKKKHNPDREFFDDIKRSPHHNMAIKTKEATVAVFSDRKKTKDKEDENYKKAIQASKRDMIREEKQEEVIRILPPKQPEPREYNKVDFEKIKPVFNYVNSTWLEAQKQAQKERGVKESDRLSTKVQVKHFYNRKVTVDVPAAVKKAQLEKLAEQMGAKIVRDPQDYCILITAKIDTDKVARAKKLRNVKILKPDFITDCKKIGAYLQERDYFHKL